MPYCTTCGSEYKQGAKFCGECGSSIDGTAPVTARRPSVNPNATQEVVLWKGKPASISDRLKGIVRLNTTTYTITSQRIMVKTGLIGKNVEEIELLRVRDLSVAQSVMDRMLGIGTLTVFSDDASAPQLLFRKIHDAQTVKDLLRKAFRDEKIANNISYREQI
ncbi:PH domain-containing protein [Paenibacillus sp. FSL K6-0276]|uniref:PH domain-containing protein n=1 Tax=Paenibacillus sp. FSL K6-0276 TaxID=2921450 RepID=UPI0030EB5808